MPRARLVYLPSQTIEKHSSDLIILQQRHTSNLIRGASSNPQGGLSPSYKLGVALGTVGGIGLLLLWFIFICYTRRIRRKDGSESYMSELSDEPPRPPIGPPPGGQARPIEPIQYVEGRPLERAPIGVGRPIELAQDDQGRPLERGQAGGGRPIERAQDGQRRPLERAHQGQGRPLERPQQQMERPLERPPQGGRARRVGNRPLERALNDGGLPPPRGGEAALQRRGWTRPSRRGTAARKKGPRYQISPRDAG